MSDYIKLETKIDLIGERLNSMDKTLIKQEINLSEHMKRSLANEESVKILSNELKPIRTHVNHVEGALKLIGLLGVIMGIISGIIKVIAIF